MAPRSEFSKGYTRGKFDAEVDYVWWQLMNRSYKVYDAIKDRIREYEKKQARSRAAAIKRNLKAERLRQREAA